MKLAGVILAAGAGRRLGTVAKALLRRADGRSFLQAVADSAGAAGCPDLVVVVGPPHQAASTAEAERLGLEVAVNSSPERGMASSVSLGFAALVERFPSATAALLWPVDHARVAPATVRLLVAQADPDTIAVPVYRGRGGHPGLFGRTIWDELVACSTAPYGARSVLHRDRARVRRIDVDDSGVVDDVDLPGDRE